MIDKNHNIIKKHLEANVPLLIIGESGWGKSAVVESVCKELQLPVVIGNANSWTAEDFGGIPRPIDNTYYDYLPPKWVIDNRNKPFVFFIDEINQASAQVLHALYRVVYNREVAGIHLPKMYIIAAGNFDTENPYLTELMEPLIKRFSTYHWEKNNSSAVKYLNAKYGVDIKEIITNPRQTEMAIKMFLVNDYDSATALGGAQLVNHLRNKSFSSVGKKLITDLEIDKAKKRNGLL